MKSKLVIHLKKILKPPYTIARRGLNRVKSLSKEINSKYIVKVYKNIKNFNLPSVKIINLPSRNQLSESYKNILFKPKKLFKGIANSSLSNKIKGLSSIKYKIYNSKNILVSKLKALHPLENILFKSKKFFKRIANLNGESIYSKIISRASFFSFLTENQVRK